MKIGVISDTHIPVASKDIPRKVIEAFEEMDMIIHAGDLVDLSVLDKLSKISKNVKAVSGNMDPCEVKNKLPERQLIAIGGFKIAVTHGEGAPNKLMELVGDFFRDDKPNVIIFGHSHQALNLKKDGIIYFNPGSPTDTVYAQYQSFGIIEITDRIALRIIKL